MRSYILRSAERSPRPRQPSQRAPARPIRKPPASFISFFQGPDIWASEDLWSAYLKFQAANMKEDYKRFAEAMRKSRSDAEAQLAALPNPFVNAKKGKPYAIRFKLPDWTTHAGFFWLEQAGLRAEFDFESSDRRIYLIQGTPAAAGDFTIRFMCGYKGIGGQLQYLTRDFSLLVNPDPRDLWEDKPSDQFAQYSRPDLDYAQLDCRGARMWAASRRGRSHAHEGKPRDDAFKLDCAHGWSLMALADGAGSAEFSRKGAELACEASIAICAEKLPAAPDLEKLLASIEPSHDPLDWQPLARKLAYDILPNAAFAAHKAIREEAAAMERDARAYASTLLLALAKQFMAGWVVMSFQIGDGAMALIQGRSALLLAEPDEGEYGGQTRFVTMNEMFNDSKELAKRIGIQLAPDLKGLLLMTDGVSDAKFPGLDGLRDAAAWREIWGEAQKLASSPDPREALLEWLNFWSRGNHDDRTIAILKTES